MRSRRRSTARRPTSPGKDIANPASLIGSAAMLLGWLGERRDDDRLIARRRRHRGRARSRDRERRNGAPRDLGGPLGTKAFGETIAVLVGGEAAARG